MILLIILILWALKQKNGLSLISNNLEEVKINTAKLLKDKNMQQIMVENQAKVINRNSAKDLVDFVQKNLS